MNKKMRKICVIGSLNMDLVIEAPNLPLIGETLMGDNFMISSGGKGANQAIAIGRLGGDVSMIGCVGDDLFGQQLIANLVHNHVDASGIKTIPNISSGVATITIVDGNNCIIVAPGANAFTTPKLIAEYEEVIKNSSLLVLQMEIPFETVKQAIELAKKHHVEVLLNPAPAHPLPDELLAQIDIITPNETECEIITGIKINCVEDGKEAVQYLMQKGVEQVFITLGKSGVVYNNGNHILHRQPPEVKVVDTTAAGDSFTGALAVKLTSGILVDEAVDFANHVGALTVSKKGAQSSLPSLQEINDFTSMIK